ncbi:hypothetical protein PMZ80_005128 [Knufia obscura]|uniref:3'-5' exonuclease domain-containing protein n=1 Tax=Knufia obscura TaxID=1635080 RepID=A0ABR0RQQ1_9EURO|nr:hypothetical protein PMZ80_005128 [Knufia obscura]
MNDQAASNSTTPALTQTNEHAHETSSQESETMVDTPWSEQDAGSGAISAPANDNWDEFQMSCGTCWQLPCSCPTSLCLNTVSSVRTASLNLATESLNDVLRQAKQSPSVQVLEPILWLFLTIQREYKIYGYRKAVAAETDKPDGYVYVTKTEHVANMVTQLADLPTNTPNIGFDMEANNLGHNSELSLLQIRDYHNGISYLVDLLLLQKAAWTTTSADGRTTLKGIFEDSTRIKLIFDCRQDSACLYAKAGVKVRGALDCQYLHMLTMDRFPKSRLSLAAAVHELAGLNKEEWMDWITIKRSQREHGVWEKRPIPAECKAYAVGDVEILQNIYNGAEEMLEPEAIDLAAQWTAFEVQRTWCKAKEYTTIRHETWPRFALCWTCKLLKDGVEPNSAPAERSNAY